MAYGTADSIAGPVCLFCSEPFASITANWIPGRRYAALVRDAFL